jgi:hypothetical protein
MTRKLAGLLQVAMLLVLAACSQPAVEPTPRPTVIPYTDVNPWGTNVFLHKETEQWKIEKTLQMARDAGIAWIKQHFPWEEIEFKKGFFYDTKWQKSAWEKFDRIVDLAEKYGLKIVARLDRPPEWARYPGSKPSSPPRNFNDYADFVEAFLKHYKGRIHYIQIWNEPNLSVEWYDDQPVNPAQYVQLLKLAYRRAKTVDPSVVVLSAPMAMTLEDFPDRRNLNDLIYIEEMYQAGAKDYFDIMSANAYGLEYPPDAPADPKVLNFQRVTLVRKIMEKYGDGGKAIWFDEYGWNAAPPSMPPEKLIWRRVTPEQQAQWTVQGIELARRDWPWAGVFFIWYFRQPGDIPPDSAEYYFGMVDPDFTPRPVYYAVKEAANRWARPAPTQTPLPGGTSGPNVGMLAAGIAIVLALGGSAAFFLVRRV